MRNFHPTNERTIRFSLRVSASFDVFDAIVLRWGFVQRSNNFEFYRACIRWRVRGQIVRRELTNDMRRNFEKVEGECYKNVFSETNFEWKHTSVPYVVVWTLIKAGIRYCLEFCRLLRCL